MDSMNSKIWKEIRMMAAYYDEHLRHIIERPRFEKDVLSPYVDTTGKIIIPFSLTLVKMRVYC